MSSPSKNVLLTGAPRCGNTAVIRRVIDTLGDYRLAGFHTEEIRQQGGRVGFRAVGLSSAVSTVLAHVDFPCPARVGRYGLDLASFKAIAGSNRNDGIFAMRLRKLLNSRGHALCPTVTSSNETERCFKINRP